MISFGGARAALAEHELDLELACMECGSVPGEECAGLASLVHFLGRRLPRVMADAEWEDEGSREGAC